MTNKRIGAIQTMYSGHHFRSRLEARWAVFFDHCGIDWKYEVEGFECEGGFRYLPDFYLPVLGLWVEVKGDPQELERDKERMLSVIGDNSPLPGFQGSANSTAGKTCNGLMVLGDIPRFDSGVVAHKLYRHRPGFGPTSGYAIFGEAGQQVHLLPIGGGILQVLNDVHEWDIPSNWPEKDWDFSSVKVFERTYYSRINDGYQAARTARFEHGQSGAV